MLLTLEMNIKDDAGNPIKTCSILKCHKQEGEWVNYGDPLFDVEVSQILVPERLGPAGLDARQLHRSPVRIGSLGAGPTGSEDAAHEKPEMQDSGFTLHKISYHQIIALDRGILRKIHTHEQAVLKIGDPMALIATEENDPFAVNGVSPRACRSAARSLALDVVLERRRERSAAKNQSARQYLSGTSIIFWSAGEQESRIGIFAKGGCDLSAVQACFPLIDKVLRGTCCISVEGVIADGRTDQLLQTLRTDLPWDAIEVVLSKMGLQRHCFEPTIFQKTFAVKGPDGPEEFPMNVVMLGSGSDLNRSLYRHRELGFLVDPGAGWLKNPEQILSDLSAVTWFRRNFVSIGQVTPEQYKKNLVEVVQQVRQRNGAHVLVFNNLNLDPRSETHNYQFIKNASETRRRVEFKLALIEVSQELGVPIIDVDRIAKRHGIETMQDFAHFPATMTVRIAEEIFGILRDLRVV